MLQFFVPGTARPAGSKQAFIVPGKNGAKARAVVADTSGLEGKHWRVQVQLSAKAAGATLLEGAVVCRMEFVRARPKDHFTKGGDIKDSAPTWVTTRPDCLKLARAIEDALTGVCWRDDAQICMEPLGKRYQRSRDEPIGVHIWIGSL
jgi:Holliday junction resolvase RusA-like endonuclease